MKLGFEKLGVKKGNGMVCIVVKKGVEDHS